MRVHIYTALACIVGVSGTGKWAVSARADPLTDGAVGGWTGSRAAFRLEVRTDNRTLNQQWFWVISTPRLLSSNRRRVILFPASRNENMETYLLVAIALAVVFLVNHKTSPKVPSTIPRLQDSSPFLPFKLYWRYLTDCRRLFLEAYQEVSFPTLSRLPLTIIVHQRWKNMCFAKYGLQR